MECHGIRRNAARIETNNKEQRRFWHQINGEYQEDIISVVPGLRHNLLPNYNLVLSDLHNK